MISSSNKLKISDEWLEGEWYNCGYGLASKAINLDNEFVLLFGFVIEDQKSEEILMVPISINKYPFQ